MSYSVPEIETALAQCIGTEHYYSCTKLYQTKSFMTKRIVYTDGVRTLMSMAGACWLVDAIVSHMMTSRKLKTNRMLRDFQIWELKRTDSSAVLTCKADTGHKPAVTQRIEHTDFPLDEMKIYAEPRELAHGPVMVLMLPSER
jgi:hypothetical protein|tara:strand:+ start:73 stop:501 length:429 start_codon:yes stop_codon:yes gene_type:complete